VGEVCGTVVVNFQVYELVVLRNESAVSRYQYATTWRVHYFRVLDANVVSRTVAVSDFHSVVCNIGGIDDEAVNDYVALI
jgi:hypothetical protein